MRRWNDWDRAAPLTGVAFTVLVAAGAVLAGSTPADNASGQAVVAFYVKNSGRERAAVVFLAFAFIALVCFASALRVYFRRRASHDGLTLTALAGAVLLAAGQTITSGLVWTLAARPGQLAPATAQALNVAQNDLVITSAVGWFIFSVITGIAILQSKALPGWLGWASIVIGIVAVTPAEFAAFLAFAVWTVIVGLLTWRRSTAIGTAEEQLSDPVLAR